MKTLSMKDLQSISGGEYSRAGYDSATNFGLFVGLCTVVANMNKLPTPYNQYYAARVGFIAAAGVAGHVLGAVTYTVGNAILSTVDEYLAPAE